ncbi:MAG: ribose 5-phosphate isomerase B [Peptococcaceae bacterium]|nr:ribose 5-phosphate isomerase B [Peptococcaceae bacterium]
MRVVLACDHGGFKLKSEILDYLTGNKIDCLDVGTYSEESVDYPDYSVKAAQAVVSGECDLGIICCGTGIGVSIAANKVPGIRAALCHDTFSARMAREHNDANILTLGQRVIGPGLALDIVDAFLRAGFQAGGRHCRRVEKIAELEKRTCP